jgi:pimeloyl-[acyl-carrier protein] methyl ester esterase
MNSSVWESCLQFFPDWIDVIRVDLPGYGDDVEIEATGLDDYVQVLRSVVDRPVIWVGWSLGGLVVLRLARLYPELVAGLFLIASSPCFVRKQNWQAAVELHVFEQFAQALRQDVDATVKRFLALQVKGSQTAMKNVRELQRAYKTRNTPSAEALDLGLNLLVTTDLRTELSLLKCPVTWLLGARDTLIPIAIADELKILHPEIDIIVEKEAAHAPFISHPQSFADALVLLAEKLTRNH